MQPALDVLRVLFFPGLLFMALCGRALAYGEGRLRAAFYGGGAEPFRPSLAGRRDGAPALAELSLLCLSLAAMAAAGVMLVGVRGDLLTLVPLFSAVELLPLLLDADSEAQAALPLAFRTRLARMASIFCVALSLSLRFPGEFAPGLEHFSGEGAFSALRLWTGAESGMVLAALAAGAASLFILNAAGAGTAGRRAGGEDGAARSVYRYLAGGMERAVYTLFLVILFLGYPWEGWSGTLLWSASAAGTALAVSAARAWAAGRDAATLRRWQEAGFVAALLSLGLALAAAAQAGA